MRPDYDYELIEWTDDGEFVLSFLLVGTDHNGMPREEIYPCPEPMFSHEIATLVAKINNGTWRV